MEKLNKEGGSAHIYDCIVVGGGISGISFAHYLHNINKDVLILEKGSNVGGQIYTHRSSKFSDFWVELGAHTCYNSYTSLLSIIDDVYAIDHIEPFKSYSYLIYDGKGVKKPFSEVNFFELCLHGSRIFFSSRSGKTVRDYFRPIVGRKNYDNLFTNMFQAVLSQNADEYPSEIFMKKRKHKRTEISRRFSFDGGLQSFLETVVKKNKIETSLGSVVLEILKDADTGLYIIKDTAGKVWYTKQIALACDPQTSSALLKNLDKAVSDELSDIQNFQSETINVIVNKDKLVLKPFAGIIPVSEDFLSAVSRDLVEHSSLRSFSFHFKAGQTSEKEKLALICQILQIGENDILETESISHTLPIIRLQHLNLADRIESKRADNNIFLLGNYFYGLSLEDCVNRSRSEFERYKTFHKNTR